MKWGLLEHLGQKVSTEPKLVIFPKTDLPPGKTLPQLAQVKDPPERLPKVLEIRIWDIVNSFWLVWLVALDVFIIRPSRFEST
jgi:hypothetical protein